MISAIIRGKNQDGGWESSVMQIVAEDPCFQQQTVQGLLDSPFIAPPCSTIVIGKRQWWPGEDYFSRLPYEIVEEIASYLPVSNVLDLRTTSQTFTPLFYSQMFWATQFQTGRERGFLFEARTSRRPCNKHSLFHRTNTANIPPCIAD